MNSQYNCCLSNIQQMKILMEKKEMYSRWQRASTPHLPAAALRSKQQAHRLSSPTISGKAWRYKKKKTLLISTLTGIGGKKKSV